MALTSGHISVPPTHRREGLRLSRHLGSVLAGAALVAASVFAFVVIDSDGSPAVDTPAVDAVSGIVDHGSITAIDHRLQTGGQGGGSLVERGSITAIDHQLESEG